MSLFLGGGFIFGKQVGTAPAFPAAEIGRNLFVAIKVSESPCPRCKQPGNDLVDGCIEYQYIHLQQHRKCGDVESRYGKKNEERIRQELVH
jgi:hypothetical protein